MEEKTSQIEALKTLAASENSVVIAISGSRRSKYVVNWALDKFIPQGQIFFKLLHVRPNIVAVPTPSKFICQHLESLQPLYMYSLWFFFFDPFSYFSVGNSIPISQVRDEVATAFRKEMEWKANEKLLPFKIMCTRRKVNIYIYTHTSIEEKHG